MKDIINDYKSYLKSKQLKIVELDYFSDSDDLNFKYERNINSDNDYSSNFNSESSEESENDNIDSIINKDSNSDDDDKDNDGDNNGNYKKNAIKNKLHNNLHNKNKSNINNNKNKQKSNRHKSNIFIFTYESIRNNLVTDKINNSLLKSGYIFNNNKFKFGFKCKDIESEVDLILYNRMKTFELSDNHSIDKNAYFIEFKEEKK